MIKRHEADLAELSERIALNERRLTEPYYQMPEVFQPPEASWPGDKEGRALLAFVSHYKMTGRINPCMEALLTELPSHTNRYLYFGPEAGEEIFEQQLSGHSWLLRGLCEHYEQFRDEFSLRVLRSVTEHLYLPTSGRYRSYPVNRDPEELHSGGVSGHSTGTYAHWKLSTDIGCAFMSIDGLSHVYKVTQDERVRALVDEMIRTWCAIDKVALCAQTHCTLTSARGMLRMYQLTGEPHYLTGAKDIFNLYVFGRGMDAAFQNLNWWGRPDTWTEPCAIVDSLMVSGELYRITRKDKYRRCAARIYQNGFASAQRPNGGAGTDSVVFPGAPGFAACDTLRLLSYEAPFCCTMRLAEGLWYAKVNRDMLYCETVETRDGKMMVHCDEYGRYMCGDLVLAVPSLAGNPSDTQAVEDVSSCGWRLPPAAVTVDGHALVPLIKYYKLPDRVAVSLQQRLLFRGEVPGNGGETPEETS